jgi:Outer membrane protein beta-barrel domain
MSDGKRGAVRRMRAALVTAALAALLIPAGAPPAQARQGLYAGLGIARQGVSAGISGMQAPYTSGSNSIEPAKPETGDGIAFTGGFGLNDYVALDLLLNVTHQDATYNTGTPHTYATDLRSVLFGLKLGVPLGRFGEIFGRAGLGGYELTYGNGNLVGGSPVDDARLSGRGLALGVGAELFFDRLGLQIAYTVHNAEFTSVQSKNFPGSLSPKLSPTLTSASVLLTYYLP